MAITNRNRNIDIYFNEIRRSKSLTHEDEVVLFEEVSNGNPKAYEEILMRTSKYVVSVANSYTNDPDLLEDLIQEANMGVMEAIGKFDPTKGFRFISYAVHWMKAYINNFLDTNSVVRIKNTYIREKAEAIKRKIYINSHREATEDEVLLGLEEMGISAKPIDIYAIKMDTVDKVWEGGDDTVLESGGLSLICSSTNTVERSIDIQYASQKIKETLSILSDKERRIVSMNFGIGFDYEMNYEQIAEIEGITKERVRQITLGAIEKMHAVVKKS